MKETKWSCSVWRPLFRVENAPLILCDRRSIKKPDLVEVDKVLPDKVEKHFFLIYREYHKWHWISNQEADEVILFLSWTPEGDRETAGMFITFALRVTLLTRPRLSSARGKPFQHWDQAAREC